MLQEDHVHMVVVIPPRIAVANAIQYIKTQKEASGLEATVYRV